MPASKIIYRKVSDSVAREVTPNHIVRNFITKDDNPEISVAVSELSGNVHATMSPVSDRIYYFITADNCKIEFENETIDVEAGSVLFIPKNTDYKMTGNFRAVLINTPAFGVTSPNAH